MEDYTVHTEKSFGNIIKSDRNQIVFTIILIDLDPNGRPFGSKSIIEG